MGAGRAFSRLSIISSKGWDTAGLLNSLCIPAPLEMAQLLDNLNDSRPKVIHSRGDYIVRRGFDRCNAKPVHNGELCLKSSNQSSGGQGGGCQSLCTDCRSRTMRRSTAGTFLCNQQINRANKGRWEARRNSPMAINKIPWRKGRNNPTIPSRMNATPRMMRRIRLIMSQ
jgi:hypothetical protein